MNQLHTIYARPNNGFVELFFISVFERPSETDIVVEQGNEGYHAHVHLKYQAYDADGCHNYKVIDGVITPTTEEAKAAEMAGRPSTSPNPLDQLRADVDMLLIADLQREGIL